MVRRLLISCLLVAALCPAPQAQIKTDIDNAKKGVFPPPNETLLPVMLWMNALTRGYGDVIRDLVEGGYPADARDAAGQNALHNICHDDKNAPLVRYLIGKGAQADAKDSGSGQTPLLIACGNKALENAKILLDA